jgi:hypothetical protein
MAGVAIVGISFASLYVGMASGFGITQSSRENLRATQILLEHMEGIRLHNWNQVTQSNMIPTTFTTQYYPDGMGTNTGPSGVTYSGTIAVTAPVISPAPTYIDKLRMVDVEIRWTSGDIQRSRRMSTIVGRDGLQNYIFAN